MVGECICHSKSEALRERERETGKQSCCAREGCFTMQIVLFDFTEIVCKVSLGPGSDVSRKRVCLPPLNDGIDVSSKGLFSRWVC